MKHRLIQKIKDALKAAFFRIESASNNNKAVTIITPHVTQRLVAVYVDKTANNTMLKSNSADADKKVNLFIIKKLEEVSVRCNELEPER